MRLVSNFAVLLGIVTFTPAALAASGVEYQSIDVKAKCANNSPSLGSFYYAYKVGGAARFALGEVRNGQLSADIALGASVDDQAREQKAGTSAIFAVRNWNVTAKIHATSFPTRLPVPSGESVTADSKYINALYDPINPEMPPLVVELAGETNKCQEGYPDFQIELWRGEYLVLTLSISSKNTQSNTVASDAFLAFIKGYYQKDYDKIFKIPPLSISAEFRDGFSKLYYNKRVLDATDERGVIDVSRIGQFCSNKDGDLLAFQLSRERLFTFSISSDGALVLYRSPIYTDIPTSIEPMNHEAETVDERRLVEFGDYIAKYFDGEIGPPMGLGNPYALHREEIWYYTARGKQRILSRLECDR
ncbi:hypothetical protein GFL92_25905 [Rhizobium leguminosarum bv. viciae]|nr:hypothetical protein [Rhizobium leguminosarum bv. viciae]TCB62756.1 hypothetical protein E0J20_04795 [Rhizobium leguminosarum bv. viciae]